MRNCSGTISDNLEQFGTIEDNLEQFGTIILEFPHTVGQFFGETTKTDGFCFPYPLEHKITIHLFWTMDDQLDDQLDDDGKFHKAS